MASFSNARMDDNLRIEISLSIEEAIRSPLEEIRIAMGKMVQAIRSLHVANERRGQGDESNDEEEGRTRPQDRRREANQHDHERNPFARNFDGRRVNHRNQGNQENHINQRLLERTPIPKFNGIGEEIKPRA
eukprot:Gb_28452 [translate_table: standard]